MHHPRAEELAIGPFGAQPTKDLDRVFTVGPRRGPEPHLPLVVEIEAIEGELGRQTRRARGDPEAPATLRPAVAEIDILMDVRLIEIDQKMPVALCTRQ